MNHHRSGTRCAAPRRCRQRCGSAWNRSSALAWAVLDELEVDLM